MKKDWWYIRWAILESIVRIIIVIGVILSLSNYLKGILFILSGGLLVWWVLDHISLMFKVYWKKDKKRK